MKRTIYLMMLAAALTAGLAFAEGTAISGDGGFYTDYGSHEWDGNLNQPYGDANGLTVTVADGVDDLSGYNVFGAYLISTSSATNIAICMSGGQVHHVVGAITYDTGNITGNKIIMTGGQAVALVGAEHYGASGAVSGNHVIMAGGVLTGGGQLAASDTMTVVATNNRVSLVGNGGSITVDGQKYEGRAITIEADIKVSSNGTGNALDIYGKDITLGGGISGTQVMNFHLVDGLSDNTAMLMHMGVANLNLTNVTTYGFDGSAVANWAAYNGKSIMLLESYNVQILGVGDSTDVEIMGADGSAVATATLGLANGGKALSLTNIQSKGTPTPEPTTGVLSLLALAALAGRKRRK